MKYLILFFSLITSFYASAQQQTENIIIITTDGFRWQEVFKGMDSAIANNAKYNQGDSEYIYKKYWSDNEKERKEKLMPFLWTTIAAKGQIFGNRTIGSNVNNANPYWFSYPGYNEIFTGYADTLINSNSFPPNPNVTVLEFLNKQPKLKGKVAAFGAWEAFDRILNEERSGILVVSAFDVLGGKFPTTNEKLMNAMRKDAYKPWGEEECLDVFTHYGAMEYLKTKKPKVLYISYGETDEWAHAGNYRSYLDAGHQVDEWLKAIWEYVQSDPQYKNKTSLLITVDHGRGDKVKSEWTSHNNKIEGADQIWLAAIGPDIPFLGELNSKTNGSAIQLYQQQFAQTISQLMGYTYKATHPVADQIHFLFKKNK